eukprot:1150391-Pelagomonas_calceolata.AAC.7
MMQPFSSCVAHRCCLHCLRTSWNGVRRTAAWPVPLTTPDSIAIISFSNAFTKAGKGMHSPFPLAFHTGAVCAVRARPEAAPQAQPPG